MNNSSLIWPKRASWLGLFILSTLYWSCDREEKQIDSEVANLEKRLDSIRGRYLSGVVPNSVGEEAKWRSRAFTQFLKENKLNDDDLVFRDSEGVITSMNLVQTKQLALKLNKDTPELKLLSEKISDISERSSSPEEFRQALDSLKSTVNSGSEKRLIRKNKKIADRLAKQQSKIKCDAGWWKCWGKCTVSIIAAAGTAGVGAATGGTGIVVLAVVFGSMDGFVACKGTD
jgi:hypothetical protein